MEVEEILKQKREQARSRVIEKVVILRTLKSGKTIWKEGTVLEPPLPPDIEQEVFFESDAIKVFYKQGLRRIIRD